jgi:AcrR family transcriptional regulator
VGRKKLVSDEQILESARAAFVERGAGASTREIARRAGVSEAVLFQRYATKADLFVASMVPPPFDFQTALPDPATSPLPGEALVRDVFLALLEYFRAAGPVLIQMQATQGFDFERFAREHPENPFLSLRWRLVRFLAALSDAKKLGEDPRWAALALFTAAHGIAMFELMGAHEGRFPEDVIEGTVGALWRGWSFEETPAAKLDGI